MSSAPGQSGNGRPSVVILTGAAGRLGRAIAEVLSAQGARIVLVDRDPDALEAMSASMGDGTRATTLAVDVTATDAPGLAFDRAEQVFGPVDAVINNAGLEGPVARVEDVDMSEVRALFEVNVFALLAFCQEAVRRFRVQGHGRIVNMASGAGTAGSGLMAPYSASKHAVLGLTRSIAVETAAVGIQVNAVCPGCVESPMMERIEARIGGLQGSAPASFLEAIPAGRYCDPSEVGELVAWLALAAPGYINGTAQVIDGALRA